MIKVIVNADDFGLCRSVNEGIILSHKKGIVTSATIMVNMPGFDEAAELTAENPTLGVGLHLNIIKGDPVAPKESVQSLLDRRGRFCVSPYVFIGRMARGKIRLDEVEKECRAQIERALGAGISLTHIDSEKHMHILPPVFKVILKLAREYGIRGLRSVHESGVSVRSLQSLKAAVLSFTGLWMKKRIREHDIMTPDWFYGLCRSGRMTDRLLKDILGRAEDGVSEIMVHPGFMTEELTKLEKEISPSRTRNLRDRELEALLNPELKRVVRERGIELIHFGEMGDL